MRYPESYFISSGKGRSKHQLVAFDKALCDAGIANYNLLKVSSILPAGATKVDKIGLREGSPLLTAYARIDSNSPGDRIATAVGVAIPCDNNDVGVIMEHSGHYTATEAENHIRAMCAEAMKNHGIEYNEILVSSIDAVVDDDNYLSLISAIAFW